MGIVKALDPWMGRRQLLLKPGAGRIERGQMIDQFSASKNRHQQVLMLRVRRQMLSAGRIGRINDGDARRKRTSFVINRVTDEFLRRSKAADLEHARIGDL